MQNNINEIIGKYTAGEKTLEETNAALKEAGVTEFHLVALTDEERAAKKQREDEEGFFDPAERGLEPKKMPALEETDKRRHPEWAGLTLIQETKRGTFAVTYDENGYHFRSAAVKFLR